MSICKRFILTAMVCAVLTSSVPVYADSPTFNALFFHPATGRNPFLMMHGTETLNQWQFEIGEYFSYGYRPLEMRQNNQRLQGVIDHSLVADLVGAIGFLDWLQLGFDFPVVLINEFRPPLVPAATPMQNKISFSDLRIELKARVLDSCSFPVGLAFIPFVTIPTGKDAYYVGDPGITGGLRVAIDGRVSRYVGLALNVGYIGGKKVAIQNVDYQHRFILSAGVNGYLPHNIGVFGEVNVEPAFSHFMSDPDMNPIEIIGGIKWDIKNTGVILSAGAGSCVICGVKGAKARTVLGVSYRWNKKEYRDKDTARDLPCQKRFGEVLTPEEIYYLKMHCPPNPADFKPGVHDDACPKYYELSELAELMMRCPPKPEDFRPGVHDDACPKVWTLADKYSADEIESVYNLMAAEYGTRCPANPEEFNPMLHDQACPKYYDLMDISLLSTRCPPDPADFRPGVDDQACPKYYTLRDQYPEDQWQFIAELSKKDSDKDRINDYLDLCPHEAEDYNGFADEDGCPDQGVAAISGGEIKTFKPVYFDFAKSDLKYDAQQALDQVIALINANTWIRKVLIGGHADERGTDEANQRISMRRADVVIQYMLLHGVRPDVILTPVGYGATKPVSVGTTEVDYARNRRVNFTIASAGFVPPRKATYRPPAARKKVEAAPAAPPEPKEAPAPAAPVPQRWQ